MSMTENPEFTLKEESIAPKSKKSAVQRFWDWLTAPSSELKDIGELRSARLAASFLFSISILIFMPLIIRTIRDGFIEAISGGLGFTVITTVFAYIIARTRWYRVAIFLFTIAYSATAYTSMMAQGADANLSLLTYIYVPAGLIIASSFLSWPFVLILTGINLGAFYATRFFGVPVPDVFLVIFGITFLIGLILILLTNFRYNTEKIRLAQIKETNQKLEKLSSQLEERVEERTQELVIANEETARRSEQITAIAELARSLTDIQDIDGLLPTIVNFVSERLGYYHVGLFLKDKSETYAVLRAANSEGGRRMLARNHKLLIGEEGIVGYVIKNGEPRIALDVGADAVHFKNPDLPDTHSEMAIPLRLGSDFIGALDIQSTEENAFSDEDISVFVTLTDQIALAIQNTRLLAQTQAALDEVEEAYAEQTGRDWEVFAKSQALTGYHFDGTEAKPVISKAKEKTKFDANTTLSINLRGQVIGKLKLKSADKDRVWTQSEMAMLEAATERTALALEGARLLENAQRRASKERAIGEISEKLSETAEIENLMKVAVGELRDVLGASEVLLEIETNKSENEQENAHD